MIYTTWKKCDAEELTRGRRAETPLVQQCDLIFPIPPTNGSDYEQQRQVGEDEEKYTDRAQREVST